METATAAAAPFGFGLRRPLNPAPATLPAPKPRPGSATKNPANALRCKPLRPPEPRLYASAATKDGYDAGGAPEVVRRKRLAVFVSGGGSNFREIHEAALSGAVRGDVVALVTDKLGCGGAEHARSNGVPVVVFPGSKSAPEGVSVPELLNNLRELEVDVVLLAGYLKLVPAELVREYPRLILNIHPSLLPAFGGKGYYVLKVHKAIIASGASHIQIFRSNCTLCG